jgi:hypothetical protein
MVRIHFRPDQSTLNPKVAENNPHAVNPPIFSVNERPEVATMVQTAQRGWLECPIIGGDVPMLGSGSLAI